MAGIEVFNQQERRQFDLEKLQRFSAAALEAVRAAPFPEGGPGPLRDLERVEVTIVNDAVISEVHEKFMNVPGATDVITFEHGEILVSADTAAAQSREFGTEFDQEIALYIVHGLLHLAGYGDKSPDEAGEMKVLQEKILARLWEKGADGANR